MKHLSVIFALLFSHALFAEQATNTSHAIAMHGETKYAKNFKHFDYAEPNAKKGGTLTRVAINSSFDSLNPFISKGNAAEGLGYTFDSLTTSSADEPFTQYGLIAKTIQWPADRSWVTYTLRPEAKFHDGKQITADDVAFSFELLMQYGKPQFQSRFTNVKDVQVVDKQTVRFNFKDGSNTELVLLVGQLSILPKHAIKPEQFKQSSLTIIPGSGPYKVAKVDAGKRITYQRVDSYWAKDLNVNKGRFNFDTINYDYYRDSTVMLEALKAGEYDFRRENISRLWATAYTGKAIEQKLLQKKNVEHKNPQGMQAFILNQRNPLFQNINVRQALNLAFDFEWTNKALFYNAYKRTNSFFSNSHLASNGLPSEAELALLKPLQDQLPESVFTKAYQNPKTDGNGNNRKQLRQAIKLLKQAGWQVENGQLMKDGKAFAFEFLIYDPSFERIINPYIQSLKKLGIKASIRKVEISQYINRMREFNFDILVATIPQSLSPGLEQVSFWHSSQADVNASNNLIGIKNPAIDTLIDKVVKAKSKDELTTATKALDRALLHNYYVIPQWHISNHRVAYWDKFSMPKTAPLYDYDFGESLNTWWVDPQKQKAVDAFLKTP